MAGTRTETDTFGPIEVESDRYWGAQAQRSLGNFKIGWEQSRTVIGPDGLKYEGSVPYRYFHT